MVLLVPLVRPLTGPSKVSVSEIVSSALLPPLPATVVKATVGAVADKLGADVSTTGSATVSMFGMLPAKVKALPAASLRPATSALFSAPSSIAACPLCNAWTV